MTALRLPGFAPGEGILSLIKNTQSGANPNKNKGISSIIIITHNSKDSSLNKIVKIIGKKIYVKKKPKLIRIDDN